MHCPLPLRWSWRLAQCTSYCSRCISPDPTRPVLCAPTIGPAASQPRCQPGPAEAGAPRVIPVEIPRRPTVGETGLEAAAQWHGFVGNDAGCDRPSPMICGRRRCANYQSRGDRDGSGALRRGRGGQRLGTTSTLTFKVIVVRLPAPSSKKRRLSK